MATEPAQDDPAPRATVLGGGTMGLGIAQVLALAGTDVVLCDADEDLTHTAVERLRERTQAQAEAGLREPEDVRRLTGGVRPAFPAEEAVTGAGTVWEAAPEDLRLKQTLLAAVSRAAPAEAVIATNTSSFPIDGLAEYVHLPQRFLGVHWFSPPEWVPGVEVISGSATAPEVVRSCHALLGRIGKQPTDVASSPAFVANRIQMALFLEAVSCVEEGLASPRQVDEIVRSSFGFRLPNFGPFQIADMAGLDVYASVLRTLQDGVAPRFAPPTQLLDAVEQGRLGTKTGSGFYDYPGQRSGRLLVDRDRRYAAMSHFLATSGSDAQGCDEHG